MKVKVNRDDIRKGYDDAGVTCGCPIWHALNRRLKLRLLEVTTDTLSVKYDQAKVGAILIPLPEEAVAWQKAAVHGERVKPFEFETTLQLKGEPA